MRHAGEKERKSPPAEKEEPPAGKLQEALKGSLKLPFFSYP